MKLLKRQWLPSRYFSLVWQSITTHLLSAWPHEERKSHLLSPSSRMQAELSCLRKAGHWQFRRVGCFDQASSPIRHTHTPLHWSTRKQNNHFEERRNQPQRGGNSVPKVNQCNLSSFCAVVFAGGGGWRWWIGFIVSVGKCSVRYHRITPPPQTCSPQHLHLTRRREGSRLISLGDFDSPSEDCCFF